MGCTLTESAGYHLARRDYLTDEMFKHCKPLFDKDGGGIWLGLAQSGTKIRLCEPGSLLWL